MHACDPGFISATWARRLLQALCLLVFLLPSANGESAPREYQIKAAFLYNFAQFVEWPNETFATAETPIRIGILGDDPFGQALEDTINGETIRHRRLVIVHGKNLDELISCQLLFISRSEQGWLANILETVAQAPILTVSDIDGFTAKGGGIRLYLKEKKVRFEINTEVIQKQHLKASSQLLSLGTAVKSARNGGAP